LHTTKNTASEPRSKVVVAVTMVEAVTNNKQLQCHCDFAELS